MAEVQGRLRGVLAPTTVETQDGQRTVSTLRARADEIRKARKAAEAARREAKRQERAREAEKKRRIRLNYLKRRGLSVWGEIESEIQKRNADGYERAAGLLTDLRVLAEEDNTLDAYSERLSVLRTRHSRKARFVERLEGLEQA